MWRSKVWVIATIHISSDLIVRSTIVRFQAFKFAIWVPVQYDFQASTPSSSQKSTESLQWFVYLPFLCISLVPLMICRKFCLVCSARQSSSSLKFLVVFVQFARSSSVKCLNILLNDASHRSFLQTILFCLKFVVAFVSQRGRDECRLRHLWPNRKWILQRNHLLTRIDSHCYCRYQESLNGCMCVSIQADDVPCRSISDMFLLLMACREVLRSPGWLIRGRW